MQFYCCQGNLTLSWLPELTENNSAHMLVRYSLVELVDLRLQGPMAVARMIQRFSATL